MCIRDREAINRFIKQLELHDESVQSPPRSPKSTRHSPAAKQQQPTANQTAVPAEPSAVLPIEGMGMGGTTPGQSPRDLGRPRVAPSPRSESLSRSAIYVNNLPNDATEEDIVTAFNGCGKIKMVNARHIATGGFAFVFFESDEGAQKALERAQVEVRGHSVNVLAKKLIPGA
eukprot:TRINITY_DN15053_c0_g1_i3.p2 TRINITY_DN15053_c0_g1~~TRINITY_DN15053_c0_g1_i3.p2  ORF type:complete len:173 (+),score=47.02 TRINITY_DN15053_c0_g1_i3:129-647(+)